MNRTAKHIEGHIILVFLAIFAMLPGASLGRELRIVYGNDNLGEIAPCGSCNYKYKKGGLAKKATALKALSGEKPLLLLDAGNLLFKERVLPPEGAEAARVKARGIVEANRKMGLTFSGIGPHDLAAGPDFLRELAGEDFRFLSANLVDRQSGRPLFPAHTTVQAGGLTVAVLALTAPIDAEGKSYAVRPWREVLPTLARQLRPRAHLVILLSNNKLNENRAIAEACPEIDLIFQSGYAMGNMPPGPVGNALITQSEIRGRYLGVLDIDLRGNGRWQKREAKAPPKAGQSSYSQRFITLNAEVRDDETMRGFVGELARRMQEAGAK